MATFGDLTEHTVPLLISGGNVLIGTPGTPVYSGTPTSISFYAKKYGTTTVHFKGVLVRASDKTIIANGITNPVEVTDPDNFHWYVATFPSVPSVLAGVGYYVTIIADANVSAMIDTDASPKLFTDSTNSYSSPTDPTDGSSINYSFSAYCTYTIPPPTIKGIDTIKGINTIQF